MILQIAQRLFSCCCAWKIWLMIYVWEQITISSNFALWAHQTEPVMKGEPGHTITWSWNLTWGFFTLTIPYDTVYAYYFWIYFDWQNSIDQMAEKITSNFVWLWVLKQFIKGKINIDKHVCHKQHILLISLRTSVNKKIPLFRCHCFMYCIESYKNA